MPDEKTPPAQPPEPSPPTPPNTDVVTRMRRQLEAGEIAPTEADELIPTALKVESRRIAQKIRLMPILMAVLAVIMLGEGLLLIKSRGLPNLQPIDDQATLAELPELEPIPDQPPPVEAIAAPSDFIIPAPNNESTLPAPPEATPIPVPE